MPSSPFPGMDPFLENPVIFSGLHDRLIFCLGEALQPNLPEPYYAEIAERAWVEVSQRPIGPDVEVLRDEGVFQPESAVGLATRSTPVIVTVPHDEMRETRLEIRARIEREEVVVAIEVLSPSNKTPGEKGRELYLQEQEEILNSRVHLVEIDLLRSGKHTTAVPHQRAIEQAGRFDYHVCVRRFDSVEDYRVYPVRMQDKLPEISVPLLPGDGEVAVDLQTAFDRACETGPYHRRVTTLAK